MVEEFSNFAKKSENAYEMDIYFIPYQESDIHKLNIDTFEISLALSPKEITLGYGPHLCPLSKTLIFIQGGIINNEFIADSFTIDLTTGEITEKACGPINAAGACIRYRDYVYIFGGANRDSYTPSNLCQKYNIEENSWAHFTPLPIPSYNNTAIQWQGKIITVGQHLDGLFYFNPADETYAAGLKLGEYYKIITAHDGVIFLIFDTVIKVFEENSWKDYSRTFVSPYSLTYSYHAYRNGYLYFIVPPKVALRLNIVTKYWNCFKIISFLANE